MLKECEWCTIKEKEAMIIEPTPHPYPPPSAVPLTPSSLRSVHTPDMLIRQGFQLITSKVPGMVDCN